MGAIGQLIASIVGIVIGLLEWLELWPLAYRIELQVERIIAWEDGINRRFDDLAGDVNQTLDQGSDGLFSAFQTGLETIQGGFAWVAGVGNTWANWPSYVNSHIAPDIPRLDVPGGAADATLPFTDVQPLSWFTNLIDAFNVVLSGIEGLITFIFYIPGILFIPVGVVINAIFSPIAGFFGLSAGFIGYTGALTGVQSAFIFIGALLVLLNIVDIFLSVSSLEFFRPGSFASDTLDDIVGIAVGFTFVMYHIAPQPVAMIMTLGGIALVLYASSERDTEPGIYSFTLTGIGTCALWLSVFGFLTAALMVTATFAIVSIAAAYTVNNLRNAPDGSTVTV